MTVLAVTAGIAAALLLAALLALAVAHATRQPGRHAAPRTLHLAWLRLLADVADLVTAHHHASGVLVVPADTPSRGAHESASFTHAALLEGLARIDDDGKWME